MSFGHGPFSVGLKQIRMPQQTADRPPSTGMVRLQSRLLALRPGAWLQARRFGAPFPSPRKRAPRPHRCTLAALSPFGKALIVALALHGILVVRWMVSAPTATSPSTKNTATELQIELQSAERGLSASVAALPPTAEPAAIERRAAASPAKLTDRAVASAAAAQQVPTVAALQGKGAPSDSAATTQQLGSAAPAVPKINLNLDSRLLRLLAMQAAVERPEVRVKRRTQRDVEAELTRKFNGALLADDVRRGYARGNVLIGSLSSAVRASGPVGGDATIRVTINSQGELNGLELLRGETSDWSAVLQSFRHQARGKRVRVPSGAQGLRVTFKVSAKHQQTSGKEVESSAVGVQKPALAPNGLTFMGDFDMADLSNETSRVVYARVVTEELL